MNVLFEKDLSNWSFLSQIKTNHSLSNLNIRRTIDLFGITVSLALMQVKSEFYWIFSYNIANFRQIKLTMKARVNSAPKMQTVFTARVKDGRQSNDSPQKHYYGRTGQGFASSNSNYFFNPQFSPQKGKKVQKAAQNDVQRMIDMKIDANNLQPEPNNNAKNDAINNQPRVKNLNKQQTLNGRKLQYPAAHNANIPQERKMRESSEIMRSSSLSSKHFTDRSTKSALIKSRKEEFDDKFKVAFGYLLDANEAYLAEKRRACLQKARPKDENFKILRPYANTTNNDEFRQKQAIYTHNFQAQNLKTANSFGPRKVCGNSTSNEFHSGKTGPRADLAQWPQGFKLQGPIYGVTTHANHFPNHGDFEKMVPVAKFNEHPLGFPHKTNSTHRTFHKGDFVPASKLSTWNNLHPYGNAFDPLRGTTYSHHHSDKEQHPIQQWPMYDAQLLRSDGKFTTEHKSNLVNHTHHELNGPNYCGCARKNCKH